MIWHDAEKKYSKWFKGYHKLTKGPKNVQVEINKKRKMVRSARKQATDRLAAYNVHI